MLKERKRNREKIREVEDHIYYVKTKEVDRNTSNIESRYSEGLDKLVLKYRIEEETKYRKRIVNQESTKVKNREDNRINPEGLDLGIEGVWVSKGVIVEKLKGERLLREIGCELEHCIECLEADVAKERGMSLHEYVLERRKSKKKTDNGYSYSVQPEKIKNRGKEYTIMQMVVEIPLSELYGEDKEKKKNMLKYRLQGVEVELDGEINIDELERLSETQGELEVEEGMYIYGISTKNPVRKVKYKGEKVSKEQLLNEIGLMCNVKKLSKMKKEDLETEWNYLQKEESEKEDWLRRVTRIELELKESKYKLEEEEIKELYRLRRRVGNHVRLKVKSLEIEGKDLREGYYEIGKDLKLEVEELKESELGEGKDWLEVELGNKYYRLKAGVR